LAFYTDEETMHEGLNVGRVFRYLGDASAYKGKNFVELRHEIPLGGIVLALFFVICVDECEFSLVDEDSNTECSWADIQREHLTWATL